MRAIPSLLTTLALTVVVGGQDTQAATVLQTAQFNGHDYQLIGSNSGGRINWTDAEAFAVSIGAHLATVNDATENEFIRSTFGPIAFTHPGFVSLLIGLNDVASEGTFVWSSHAPVTFTNFISGEPAGNSADEDFIGMVVNSGKWHDIISDFRFNDVTFGVVEIEPIPLPSPIWLLGTALVGVGFSRRRI